MRWWALLALTGCHPSVHAQLETNGHEVECPTSTEWTGEVCRWRYVITDVSCPPLTVWDGRGCVGTTVTCPEGSAWNSEACIPIGEPVGGDTLVLTNDSVAEPAPVDAFHYP